MRVFILLQPLLLSILIAFGQDIKDKKEDEVISYTGDLPTLFEKSGYQETPSYDETIRYCQKMDKASDFVSLGFIGKSPEGRDIPIVIVDIDGYSEAREIRQTDRAVVLIQAGIHAGEINGKDAGFLFIRDIIEKKKYAALLRNISILFIPIYNVDGHEHFGPYNRINQNGPLEMGWRTTATNLNLNRDYLKADAKETKAWIHMFNEWLPDFFIDIHSTDGADYQYVLTYVMEVYGNMSPELTRWQKEEFLPYLSSKMEKENYPIFPYVAFRKWHDPRSGLQAWGGNPMISQGYTAIQNRPGLLIESHMLKDYKTRVFSTYKMLHITIDFLNRNYLELKDLVKKADDYAASETFRKNKYPLSFKASSDSLVVGFKGFDYEIVKSDLTGGNWFQYKRNQPATFQIPFFDHLLPAEKIEVPEAYIIPQQFTEVLNKLEMHGLSIDYLRNETSIKVKNYRITNIKYAARPFEGRQRILDFDYEVVEEVVRYPKGTAVIDMAQPASQVAIHALEPKAPSSFLYWGFFNGLFEQKEYAETYVMEKVAREMIEKEPGLKEEFEAYLENNPELKGNQWEQLNWFYKRTPYWDDRLSKYPVGKLMDATEFKNLQFK